MKGILLVVLLVLTGCSSSETETVEITTTVQATTTVEAAAPTVATTTAAPAGNDPDDVDGQLDIRNLNATRTGDTASRSPVRVAFRLRMSSWPSTSSGSLPAGAAVVVATVGAAASTVVVAWTVVVISTVSVSLEEQPASTSRTTSRMPFMRELSQPRGLASPRSAALRSRRSRERTRQGPFRCFGGVG